MGYESRLYVVDKSNIRCNGLRYAEKIASFDLCVATNYLVGSIKEYPETDCYIYAEGEELHTDCYGDVMNEIPLQDMINLLEEAIRIESYRRLYPALGLLKGFWKGDWGDNLVVLHYGY